MAKVKTPTGSGVSFSPDPTMNGPYNYTRADIPLYKPGAGYHTMVASPPGAPVTQTPLPPVTTTATPTPRPSGRNMASTAAVSPMMANPRDIPSANRTEMDRVALGGVRRQSPNDPIARRCRRRRARPGLQRVRRLRLRRIGR